VTTCESLWMGVPVLSLRGVRPASRNAAAILARTGLGDWAVDEPAQYVAIAERLPHELDRLAHLRSEMRERLIGTLCDAKGFTRELESVYRRLWLTKAHRKN
jgi:protein O-GlcNAc transferase